MSIPHEASLTDKERAILAGLAAQAEADDPSLAETLRGRARRVGKAPGAIARMRVPRAVSHWGWGAALAAAGLVLMLVSLSSFLILGFVGALLVFAGVYRVSVTRPSPVRRFSAEPSTPATSDN